ncbi:GDYXXLXY domain-containing protein [Litchfieldia alkalitelluris]|uniref:GDYXXLXY domain-containing protein n=1 Tax=Litchfieldia alkalitelluris TaxID=304268 RepID=UPI000996FEC2|nr:GDYXXLXY domain-containing protein [Litchfieldia alkalitelluris]
MKKIIPLGYLGGIILIITSIIYFFAANWEVFSRFEQLGLAVSSMLLIYFCAFLTSKLLAHQTFLYRWFLVGGAITFGVSVALVGQIYNSHADSYMLFVIWFLPTLAFAIITKYVPFWILSYILFHLSYWFYLNPSSYVIVRSDKEQWSIFFILAFINFSIFMFIINRRIQSKMIRYLSFIATHLLLIGISFFELYSPLSGWTNLIYIVFILLTYYFTKSYHDRGITIILFIMGSIYIFAKLIELPFLLDLDFLAIQFIGVIISISLIIGGVFLARKITSNTATPSLNIALRRILIVIVTLFGSAMFVASFGGLLFIFTSSEYSLVFVSFLFITMGVLFKKLDSTARHTILFIGFFSGLAEAFLLSTAITILFIIVSVVVTIIIKDGVVRIISYSTALGSCLSLILDTVNYSENIDWILIVFAFMNLFIAFIFSKIDAISKVGYFYFLAFLLVLPIIQHEISFEIIYNLLFFLVTSFLIVLFAKKEQHFYMKLTTIFWFVFIIFTYYDFVWSLVHKSLSFFVIGAILFIVTLIIDHSRHTDKGITLGQRKWVPVLVIIIIQVSVLGYQVTSNELLLKNGKEITLKLAPVDPRSLLQGDYVQLGYEVGGIDNIEELPSGTRVYVILKEDNKGIYQRTKLITTKINPKDYPLEENEVLLAGNYNGYDTIIFGIESYFVKEGTGLEIERTVEFAKVAVSKKGDAILQSIY